jgi:phosphoribosylanthranilate isomerase
MWIKICGNTNLEDARAAADAGADALGFVFAPSPRRISPRDAARIVEALPEAPEKIGVFVNQSQQIVLDTALEAGMTGVQLHGDEDAVYIRSLARELKKRKVRIYKALSMGLLSREHAGAGLLGEVEELARDGQLVFALLVDAGVPGKRGGSGKTFEWDKAAPLVRFLQTRHKVAIAGGLNPANVVKAVELFRPWGVDVVSGVEREPGKKDHDKVREFIAAARSVSANTGNVYAEPRKA